ncbi:MAG: helix-turn-helix transcriptional regulator [Treponema sp.]|nr:helix-turn-helix transcriptional regulator [Treponema sp.]
MKAVISRLFKSRDELSFGNIRGSLWALVLIFPLSVIAGNLRYFDHSIALSGIRSSELSFFALGFGWLILSFIPKRFIIPSLLFTAIACAALTTFQVFMPFGPGRFTIYLALKFFNGLSAACAFYIFCFTLNNIERLFGLALIQLYYGFYFSTMSLFPPVHTFINFQGNIVISLVFLLLAVICLRKPVPESERNEPEGGKDSRVPLIIALCIIYYVITYMSNQIEWAESSVSSLAFGLGSFTSISLVVIIQMLKGRSALYIWLMFLAFSLLGLGALLYDAPITAISGSFAYGLGDGLGYIIIYYMCSGAIKLSRSLRMFKFFCLAVFIQYFVISGIFSFYFSYFEAPDRFLAFGVVLVLVSGCLVFMPFIQKRLFEQDWTDGLYLKDIEEYSKPLAETAELKAREHLNLTAREEEIFTMLLSGSAPKEIAYTLKISYDTVNFHQKNLYRKLDIQSRAELFARYLHVKSNN